MNGPFYHDSFPPFTIASNFGSVTLASTFKAMHIAAAQPALGNNFFNWAGKAINIRGFGKMTTAATPGNVQFGWLWGTGADNNGTNVGQTTTQALSTTQTNMTFEFDVDVICEKINDSSANGSLLVLGRVWASEALWAPHLMIPLQTAAGVAVDLTANNVLSLQILRSGSTAETAQLLRMRYTALD